MQVGGAIWRRVGGVAGIVIAGLLWWMPAAACADTNQPIKIVTWIGPWTGGYDIWDNQNMLKTRPGDEHDVELYPSESSITKLKEADVVYLQNHGGVVTTHPIPWPWTTGSDHLMANLSFPTNNDEGPSLVLAWGCENGCEKFTDKSGATQNLLKKYAKGFGIDCSSPTKVYVGPQGEPNLLNDYFQEKFFEEFSKGNVTVEAAARTAAAHWGKKAYYNPPTFEEMIGICGNRNLTLNQLRENVSRRKKIPTHSLLFVIDGSGSMKGAKLQYFKDQAKKRISGLGETAEVGLLMFNGCGKINELSEYRMLTPANKKLLLEAIDGINAEGDTNIAEATAYAAQYQVDHAKAPNQSLIVLTDGEETCNGDPEKAAEKTGP